MAGRFKAKPSAKPRVLAVDDEILNLRLATLMLQKSGFEVDQATDGYKALEMMEAKHQEYCLVTLDEVMPKLRGSEMLALWRKHEEKLQLPRLLVVMVTANGQLDDRITYGECGADGLLIKPLNISKVGMELVDLLHYTWETQGTGLDPQKTFGSLCNLHATRSKNASIPAEPSQGASTSDVLSPEPPVPSSNGRSNHDMQAMRPTASHSVSGARFKSDALNGAQQQALEEAIKDNVQHKRRTLLMNGAAGSAPQSPEKSKELESLLTDGGFKVTVHTTPDDALGCIYEDEMPDIVMLRGTLTMTMQFAEAAVDIEEMAGIPLIYVSEQRLDAGTVCCLHLAGVHDVIVLEQLEDIELVAKMSRFAKLKKARR